MQLKIHECCQNMFCKLRSVENISIIRNFIGSVYAPKNVCQVTRDSMQNIFFFFIEHLVTTGNESGLRVVNNRLDLTGFPLIG